MPLGRMNKYLWLLMWLFLSVFIPKGKAISIDTSKVIVNNISPDIYKKFRNDKDFIYYKQQPVVNNFWNKLWQRIADFISYTVDSGIFHALLILSFIAVFILFLLGGTFQTLFLKNKSVSDLVKTYDDQEIEITDFNKLISQELEKGNLNLAVRYLYLMLLQRLSQRQYIRLQKDKTNREYAQELSQSNLYYDFKSVTHAYECVWYGKFQISYPIFSDIRDNVNQLINKIND